MNIEPDVIALGDGRFRVRDMMWHMDGYWELYVDVARGPLVVRAQDAITIGAAP